MRKIYHKNTQKIHLHVSQALPQSGRNGTPTGHVSWPLSHPVIASRSKVGAGGMAPLIARLPLLLGGGGTSFAVEYLWGPTQNVPVCIHHIS